MWVAEGHHFSHVGISVQSLFAMAESVTDWLRLEGLCRASCPTPTVFQTQFLRQVMLWLNELERGCCCQRCVSRMAGTAPELSPWGTETAGTGVSGQNKPRPLPCPKAGPRQTWAWCFGSKDGLHKGLPISEAGWLKKCREKQRQQATKQPGGRTESMNKSTSLYHTALQEQYFDTTLFISQGKYKEGFNLIVIFSSNTRDPQDSNY